MGKPIAKDPATPFGPVLALQADAGRRGWGHFIHRITQVTPPGLLPATVVAFASLLLSYITGTSFVLVVVRP